MQLDKAGLNLCVGYVLGGGSMKLEEQRAYDERKEKDGQRTAKGFSEVSVLP